MLHIIYFEPEIAGNSGAAIRLSACTGSMLHLVEPFGFDMEDSKLRRAGLDYHDLAHVQTHPDLEDAFAGIEGNIYAFTGHATTFYGDISYQDGDALLFGKESTGLPQWVLDHPQVKLAARIPMLPERRSLNLTNSASIVLYEAWRQLGYPGGV
ncbi:putative RNA methyltransferase, TrmH family, group 2 [Gleimia coleocanis DSM 15436]|uniref:Putative tRNA (cytidine(34)-2'-O)-methyltransferase n=1 Tax=Gleimia coleocanis DSM 15436 TaxID=525245 RepID=C0W0I6_9ACTO|nr:tRNA (cytidine(34)-2'-O)-methyltransferase [Gleimia coleocanis]EEH64045.1 putative RNA methyltransferase, TrmH family, group 2 [Gleimia coleocanis DSM 15436]